MRILLIGGRGQLGTALSKTLAGHSVIAPERAVFDLRDRTQCATVFERERPELVINAAAYNFVDKAEEEPEAAFAGNAFGPRHVAMLCRDFDATLVHVSTDYVFGADRSRQSPYREEECPGPLSVYGASKLAGEQFVAAYCARSYVIRTCGLYGRAQSAGKGNFVETMLRLGRERPELRVVDDQACTPTSAADLARWIAALIETRAYGLYHATNGGATTWCRLARETLRQAGLTTPVIAISTADFGAKAARPAYSVLDTTRLTRALGSPPRPWEEALAEYLTLRAQS